MSPILDYMSLCRLCLVKDKVNVPIFGDTSDVRQIFLKISACLPVKVSQDDNLPKSICDSCMYKVDLLYQFWNTTVNSEKQLIQWLEELGIDVNMKNSNSPSLRIMPQSHAHPHSMPEAIILKEESQDPEMKAIEQGNQNYMENQQYSGYEMPYQPQVNMTVGPPTDFTHTEAPTEEPVPKQQTTPTKPTPAKRRGRPPKQKTEPVAPLPAIKPPPDPITTTSMGTKRRSSAAAAAAAVKAAVAEASSDESDVDDPRDGDDYTDDEDIPSKIAKEEADSEDEEYDDNPESLEPTTFVGVPSTSACDSEQPGPSGLGGGTTSNKTSSALPATAANESGSGSQLQLHEDPLNKSSTAVDDLRNQYCKLCKREFISRQKYMAHKRALHAPKTMPCNYCGKMFSQRSQLKLHESFHKRVPIPCEICKKIIRNVDEHKRRVHAKLFPYQCDKCDQVYQLRDELILHQDELHSGKPVECKVCNKLFSHIMYLKTHQKLHASENKKHKCNVCGNVYKTALHVRQHIQIDHGIETPKNNICNICGKILSSNTSLREHKMRHAGKKPFSCQYCQKSFVTRKHLRVHIRIHTGEKPFTCVHCGRAFTQRYCLKIHERLHTGERPYQCETCDKTFLSKSALKMHMKIHDPVFGDVKLFTHYCDECGKGFSTATKLSHHKEADHLGIRYPCVICEKEFRSSYYLSIHVKTHDDNYKPREFKCQHCDKIFETNRSLKSHTEKVHENVPPAFMCDICGKRVSSAVSLRDHKLTHTGNKPFECPYCCKCFIKQNNLVVHIRTHTHERPYSCEECGKSFSQIGTLKLHRRLHSGERPFICQICSKKFVSKSALNLHFSSHGITMNSKKRSL